jgi:hypothetical protein
MTSERGILFTADMVRAILAGRKTVTRRLVNEKTLRVRLDRPVSNAEDLELAGASMSQVAQTMFAQVASGSHPAKLNRGGAVTITASNFGVKPGEFHFRCPYVDGVTHLFESPRRARATNGIHKKCWTILPRTGAVADGLQRLWVREAWRGRPGAVKFRADGEAARKVTWKSPLHLPRKLARIELAVQEVRLEHLHEITDEDARQEGVADRAAFEALWKSINGEASWTSDPWIWVISFARLKPE